MSRTLKMLAVPLLAGAFALAGTATAQAGQRHDGVRHQHSRSVSITDTSGAERGKHHKRANHQAPAHPRTGSGNHQGHMPCTVAPKCRPAPLPKPQGGWPCAKTHSCAQHHHYPICKPPIVVHHRPPIVTPHQPASHVAGHKTPVVVADALPRTGVEIAPMLLASTGLIGLGALLLLTEPLRRFTRRARVRS